MKLWKAKFYSGTVMTVKAKDYFGARGKVDSIIASCNGKPVLFSLSIID